MGLITYTEHRVVTASKFSPDLPSQRILILVLALLVLRFVLIQPDLSQVVPRLAVTQIDGALHLGDIASATPRCGESLPFTWEASQTTPFLYHSALTPLRDLLGL